MSWETMTEREKNVFFVGVDFADEKEQLESLMLMRNYEDLPAHFEKHKKYFDKWRKLSLYNADHPTYGTCVSETDPLMDEDWALRQATRFLVRVLEQRVIILKRVSNLYRQNELELLELGVRRKTIRDKISYSTLEWRPLCGGFINLLQYPMYLLNVKRLIDFYSKHEIEYMKKWRLASMPLWLDQKTLKPMWVTRKHSSGVITQYLGEDGCYSSFNDCELDIVEEALI
tara:strand:- start:156 stop:842 length:687 start_codon:yes stop_codon:yes gene_type:complete